jgi:peroxiredoxin
MMDLPKKADLERCSYNETYKPGKLVDGSIITFSGASTAATKTSTLSMYSSDATHTYTLNGRSFHSLVPTPIPLQLGTEQKWVIRVDENSDSGHPFHIHVNPFRLISVTTPPGQTAPVIKPGTWRDTLYVDVGWSYEIQSLYKKDKDKDIGGLSVLHCHILDHEDQGMMWPIYLSNDPAVAAAGAAPVAKPALKAVSTRSPAIKLPDAAGKSRELAEFKGRRVALVFLRGIQCFHCAEQLRDLVREARDNLGPEAEIVAISSNGIKDPANALSILGVNASDRFHLLVDERKTTFRAYSCLTTEPQHGLFIIDEAGLIRWSYVGETPFTDTKLVVERLRGLDTLSRERE